MEFSCWCVALFYLTLYLTLYMILHTTLAVSNRADYLNPIAKRVFTPQEIKDNLAALADLAKNAATYISLDTTAMLK